MDILNKGKNMNIPTYIGSLIRHTLSGLGGGLIAMGITQTDASNFTNASVPIVLGIASWGLGHALSIFKKH